MPPRTSAPLPAAAGNLSRLLDEALALLEPRYPALPGPDTASPLPSLLDRCEALLARSTGPAPGRLVLGFGRSPVRVGVALLSQMPGVQLLRDAFGPIADERITDQALAPRRPAAQRSHVGLGPGLVDEHQPPQVDAALMGLPARTLAGNVGSFLLSGERGFS